MPEAAIRLSRLLRDGAPISQFVSLLNDDAALSVEVLRMANSSVYGATFGRSAACRRLSSESDLGRVQSIMMTAQLRSKILKPAS